MRNDPNLQFAILAFRLRLIDAVQFTEALSTWSLQSEKTLADVLTDNGWLTPEARRQVESELATGGHGHPYFLAGDLRSNGGPVLPHANSPAVPESGRFVDLSAFEPTVHSEEGGTPETDITVVPDEPAIGHTPGEAVPIPDFGERRSRYVLTKLHAIGGLGRIWVAWDEHLHREVALKELMPSSQRSPKSLQRFLREAQITGQLEHPSIVPVYELSTDANRAEPFYVMRLVRGKTLRKALDEYHEHRRAGRQDPLELSRLLNAFMDVCNAVAYAHSRGVVHRDLKPDNVLLGSFGEVVLLDWGLAKSEQSDEPVSEENPAVSLSQAATAHATHAGSIMGTPAYMAPEQAQGRQDQVDTRTDVYGLGAILFCILTGSPPHLTAKPVPEILAEILQQPTPHVRNLDGRLPAALDAICAKAMSKVKANRYGQASELADDIQRYLVDEPVLAMPDQWTEKLRRWRQRNPAVVSALTALVFTSIAALLVGLFFLREEQAATDEARQLAELAQKGSERRAASEAIAREDAESARAAESRERRQAQLLACEMVLRRGLTLSEQGNVAAGQLWLARGLGMVPSDETTLAKVFRANLGSWQRRLIPLRHIFDQSGTLTCATFSPNGKLICTGGTNGTVQLWDAATGAAVGEPLRPGSGVEIVRFSPDGSLLAAVLADASIALWNLSSAAPQAVGQLRAHTKTIRGVSFAPDGKTLATASDDDTAILWDIAKCELRNPILQHSGHVWAIEVSPDGKWLATGSADQTARVWNLATGQMVGEPLQHANWVWSVAFRPDSQVLATSSADGDVRLWEVNTGKPIGEPFKHDGDVRSLVFSPDGRSLLTGCNDNHARLWNVSTARLMVPPLRHHGPVRTVSFSPDGAHVLTGSMDNTAQIWDTRTGLPLESPIEHQGQLLHVEFNGDGSQMLTVSADRSARLWDTTSRSPLAQTIAHDHSVLDLALSGDGRFLVTSGADRRVRVWNLSDGKQVAESPEQPGPVLACEIATDGKRFLCGGSESWLRFYEMDGGKEVGPALLHPAPIDDIAISPDGKHVGTGSWDGHVRIFDGESGEPAADIAAHKLSVRCLTFSHNGKYLATGSPDSSARIWSVESQQPLTAPLLHDDQVTGVAFSPDDRWLATSSLDKSVRIWEVASGALIPRIIQHLGAVRCVAFSPDGNQIATGSHDKTVRRWDAATGLPLSPPWEHTGSVGNIIFIPGRTSFVTGCTDGLVRVWNVSPMDEGSISDVQVQVEVMTGMELTGANFVRVLSAASWRDRIERQKSPRKSD